MSTLIVYSSKYGCTKNCTDLLQKRLKYKVDIVNLKTSKYLTISQYDKVIIGGSIYIGKIQKEVREFCSRNIEKLKEKQIGLFICGMQEGEMLSNEFDQNFPKELLNAAIAKECFGGEFNFSKMNFLEKFIVKKISKVSSNKSNILTENINKFAQAMNSI